ncbi:MAG TPA: cytochrome c biogenesis protein CcdA [Candidatus Omnitrophota bacterium]|nr:cytochrome c biogenesis protein CcdA [Candidatus Omnitrophota bacterium]
MTLSGNPFDYLTAFFGGVLLSFTPCVYPLIPITISFIGINAAGSKLKGFLLSLTYTAGIAITYSILGIIASLTGRLFGELSFKPLTYFFAAVVVFFFGLSMLDMVNLSLVSPVKLPVLKKQNYFSTFLLGLISGLIISPCVTPALVSILVYLASRKNIIYGATLLFSFAFGMGLLLIVVGTFSSILLRLPKSGKWLVYIKRIGAFILIGMGIYLLSQGIRRL